MVGVPESVPQTDAQPQIGSPGKVGPLDEPPALLGRGSMLVIEEIRESKCTGCRNCVLACPMDLIRFDREKKVAVFTNPGRCVVCYNCTSQCPEEAITVGPDKPSPFPAPLPEESALDALDLESFVPTRTWRGADVLIVGAGVAGLAAAIAAREKGASVLVLDKAPDTKWTNTTLAGGIMTIAKEKEMYPEGRRFSVEEKVQEAMEVTDGRVNPELVAVWRQQIDDTLSWLRQKGVRFSKQEVSGTQVWETGAAIGTRTLGAGAGLNKQLLTIARRAGCQIYFSTRVVKLLTGARGDVNGIRAVTSDGVTDFMASAVVLATAGFQANKQMLERHVAGWFARNVKVTGSPYSIGDGHFMAREVGAKMVGMDQFVCKQLDGSWVPGSAGHPGPRQLQPYHQYGILVNKLGRRFIDECAPWITSTNIGSSIAAQPDGEAACIWDERIGRMMGAKLHKYVPSGIVRQARTTEELAGIVGCSAAHLEEAIQEFNSAVSGGAALDVSPPKSRLAFVLEAPFYVIHPMWAGLNATLGGPAINGRAEVLKTDSRPIPGLYAAGEMIGGFFFGSFRETPVGARYYRGNYQVTSSALPMCLVFGRVAGQNAAAFAER